MATISYAMLAPSRKFILLFWIGLILSAFLSCSRSEEYRKIEMPELLERLKNNEVNLVYVSYKDSLGNDLTDELRSLLNQGLLMRNFYANRANEIEQIRLTKYSDDLVFNEIQIRELLTSPFNVFEIGEIDCAVSDSLIMDCFQKDQDVRKGLIDDIIHVDSTNQKIVISLLERCPWPNDPEIVRAVWFVIQHADSAFMAYFYPKFKQMVKDSLLSASTMALMEDRMLMNNGYPQIYGSQIVRESVYQLRDPDRVNELRASVGLGTIEEHVKKFGFEYSPRLIDIIYDQ